MAKASWYTRTSWHDSDRDDFHAQLRATTGANEQAACLRKQAAHLLAHATKLGRRTPADPVVDQLLAGARELFETFLDWFGDSAERAYVFAALGEIEERSGAVELALTRYREALAAQEGTPRSTNAHLRFAVLVTDRELTGHYPEALALLERHAQPLIYPLEQYHHCGSRAHLLAERGERALAVLCATDALAATKHIAVDESLPFHRRLVHLVETGGRKPSSATINPKPEIDE